MADNSSQIVYVLTNLRYLKATGLVQNKGRGLSLVPEKHVFVEKLIQDTRIPDSDRSYFITLCNGATLPTDHKESALAVLDDLLQQLNRRSIPFDITGKSTNTPADIALIRYQIEEILSERNEDEYATRQAVEWEEMRELLDQCSDLRPAHEAPSWKQEIDVVVQRTVSQLNH